MIPVKTENAEPLACDRCNDDFTPIYPNQIYCSVECRKKAKDKRHKSKTKKQDNARSKRYYENNKEKWKQYRKTRADKVSADPKLVEEEKENRKEALSNYKKNHPGLPLLRREGSRDRLAPDRKKRVKEFGPTTLLAVARVLAREAKKTEDKQEAETLKSAALILTVRAGGKLLTEAKGKVKNEAR